MWATTSYAVKGSVIFTVTATVLPPWFDVCIYNGKEYIISEGIVGKESCVFLPPKLVGRSNSDQWPSKRPLSST